MVNYKFIGARLRAARLNKNLTQEQVAAMVDVGVTHISHIETGTTIPSTKLLVELMDLLEKMTINPAMLYHLKAGRLTEGGPADLVLFDPEKKWVVEEQFYSKASNSPFIGMELTGQVQYTICGGKVVFER